VTRFFRLLVRPNLRSRRLTAFLSAAFLLAVVVFSSAFVAFEADHDCEGHDCPVCLEMQDCLGNFQLMGSSGAGDACVQEPAVALSSESFGVRAYRAPALTLQRLDVRFDE